MRLISIILLSFLLIAGVPPLAKAEATEYWVVGSYKSLTSAVSEKRRIEVQSGLPIQVGTFKPGGETFYRLLIEKDGAPERQRENIKGVGVSPWTLSVDSTRLDLSANEASEYDWSQFLVLAGFRNESRGRQLVETLKSKDISDIRLDEIRLDGEPYFRVLYGPFETKNKAVLQKVKDMGFADSWWVIKEKVKSTGRLAAKAGAESETTATVTSEGATGRSKAEPKTSEKVSMSAHESKPQEPPPAMPVDPPLPGESWLAYCVKRANSAERERFCKDGEFMSTAVKGEQAKRGYLSDQAYFEFCARQATAAQRKQYCTNGQLGNELGR